MAQQCRCINDDTEISFSSTAYILNFYGLFDNSLAFSPLSSYRDSQTPLLCHRLGEALVMDHIEHITSLPMPFFYHLIVIDQ